MRRTLGIEVGRTFVALCELALEGETPASPRFARRVLPPDSPPEEIADLALALALGLGSRQREGVLALGRALTWDKPVALPPLSEDERRRLLTVQPERFFPVGERSVVCDLEPAPDGALPVAHAADAQLVEGLVEALQSRGFRITAVLPAAAALRRAALRGAPELAASNWLLVRAEDGDLAALACRDGELRVSRRLEAFAERPEAALREVSRTARQTFDPATPLEEVRWVGWGELPEELRRLAGESIPLPVRDLPDLPVGSEGMAAYGAALAGAEEAPRPDLLPAAVRARRSRQARWVTAACAALVVLGALALLWALDERGERRLRSLEAAVAAARPRAEEAAQTRDSLLALEARISAVQRRMEDRARWIAAPAAVARALPPASWVSSLAVEGPGQVSLAGYAATASALVPALERTAALAGVELAAPATRTAVGGRELEAFNVRGVLEGSPADSARTVADTASVGRPPAGAAAEAGP